MKVLSKYNQGVATVKVCTVAMEIKMECSLAWWHTFNPSTWEMGAGESLSLKPACST